MKELSICGIDCAACKFKLNNTCNGCRSIKGRVFWGECDLYKCCKEKSLDNCGECSEFPCDMLKEWATSENPERIQNLIDSRSGE